MFVWFMTVPHRWMVFQSKSCILIMARDPDSYYSNLPRKYDGNQQNIFPSVPHQSCGSLIVILSVQKGAYGILACCGNIGSYKCLSIKSSVISL